MDCWLSAYTKLVSFRLVVPVGINQDNLKEALELRPEAANHALIRVKVLIMHKEIYCVDG